MMPDSERGTIRGPETASLFYPQSFVQPKPCCPEFPHKAPLYRKFIGYGCFLLLACGFQLMALGLSEVKQFNEAIGEGFYLVENYFKAAGAGTCFVASLVGTIAIRLNSLRAMIGFICLLSLNIVLVSLAEVMTRSYSVDQTIHGYVKEYVQVQDDYSTSAKKMLNRIQHEFGCCGGRHGADDFGKQRDLLPASCCYEAHHEHGEEGGEHEENGKKVQEHFCNKSATPQAVHPSSCSQVTGRYLRHVLLASEITGMYSVIVSFFCIVFGVLYGLQVYHASQGHKAQRQGEDLRAAEDASRALLLSESTATRAPEPENP